MRRAHQLGAHVQRPPASRALLDLQALANRSGHRCICERGHSRGEERDHPRWPWTVAIETLLLVPVLDAAPPVEAIGVAPRSMSQQSHIRIGPEHYERAVEALASVAQAPAPG